jgi:hypothetical protein
MVRGRGGVGGPAPGRDGHPQGEEAVLPYRVGYQLRILFFGERGYSHPVQNLRRAALSGVPHGLHDDKEAERAPGASSAGEEWRFKDVFFEKQIISNFFLNFNCW